MEDRVVVKKEVTELDLGVRILLPVDGIQRFLKLVLQLRSAVLFSCILHFGNVLITESLTIDSHVNYDFGLMINDRQALLDRLFNVDILECVAVGQDF